MSRLLVAILTATSLLLTACAMNPPPTELQMYADDGSYKVEGAVIHPGTFHYPESRRLTLGQAIRRSGGPWQGDSYNDGGDLSLVHLQRLVNGSVVEYTLDASPAGHDEAFLVKPGDYIRVPMMPFSTVVPIPAPFAD